MTNATVREKTVIAICSTTGPQSGKSTYLNTVLKRYPTAEHVRFSDPLISFLCEGLHCLHGKSSLNYEALKRAELLPAKVNRGEACPAVTGRDFMIAAGDALRKALRPSFYADILIERLSRLEAPLIVLDDLRKIPEVEALVNSEYKLLVVNVINPTPGTNDCEFEAVDLSRFVNTRLDYNYMEVTWDGNGSFKRLRR